MLKERDAIRTERIPTKRYKVGKLVLIYSCTDCGKEIKRSHHQIKLEKTKSFCQSCANRNIGRNSAVKISETLRSKPFEYTYKTFIKKAKLYSNLTYTEYLEFTNIPECHYCNDKIEWKSYTPNKSREWKYYLDRKDNNIGYTKDNCVVCCTQCNYIKGNRFTYEEFLLLSPALKDIISKRTKYE